MRFEEHFCNFKIITRSSDFVYSVSAKSLQTDLVFDIKLPKFLPKYKSPCFSVLNSTIQ